MAGVLLMFRHLIKIFLLTCLMHLYVCFKGGRVFCNIGVTEYFLYLLHVKIFA